MRIQLFSCLSLIPFCLILFIVSVSSQCLNHQQSLLMQLKNTIRFKPSLSTKIVSWNQTTDCCSWEGVNCSTDGHVIGLDLSNEGILGGIENSSPLFSLHFLRSLNLAHNKFDFRFNFHIPQIPPGIGNLTNLEYLNLSSAGFSGQYPGELSNMIKLVTLDLSFPTIDFNNYYQDKFANPNLSMLLHNLKELTELYLDGVNISAQGYDWCQAISSSSPKLKVLSLTDCSLSGPIDASFAKLQSLSVIRLSDNNLNSTVPEFFANFTNLTVLDLSYCQLYGQFPRKIFQVPTLKTLDLTENVLLNGFLPDSIGNLRILSSLILRACNFSGQIPHSMASLTQLAYLDLSRNHFSGPIPSFQKSKNLTYLNLSYNGLSGPIPNTCFEGLVNLATVDLSFNAFNGSIPPSLFALSSLVLIVLSNNNFHGLLANFPNASSSLLHDLDLSSNRLEGPIPKSFFDLRALSSLSLSYNHLNGTVELEAFSGLDSLTYLDLSYNNLSIETRGQNFNLSAVRHLGALSLASCKLQYFPNLENSGVIDLDLSNNQIGGEIPSWVWKLDLYNLNLSHNMLVNSQLPYEIPTYLGILDLHSNRLYGEIPVLPYNAIYVDYSDNQLNSSLPVDFGYSFMDTNYFDTGYFSISNNSITGRIPDSICIANFLKVLDLSNNYLSGMIPSCLVQLTGTTGSLQVLNLGNNNLSGNIPGTFPRECRLETLDLQGNRLKGKVPISLSSCSMLEVLNLGNNLLNDTFPCFLNNCTNLRILTVRSNKLHGDIHCRGTTKVWSKLQIIDLSSNYFSGHVPRSFFLNWTTMIANEDGEQSKLNYLQLELYFTGIYYFYKVIVVNKGHEIELVKIMSIFTSIDFSNNGFSGEIPGYIGELKALHLLNISHNVFTGSIPASIGDLKQLESLDLSVNNLAGRIPTELGNLTFLSFLNLSHNLLEGRIPAGRQLQTFTETSFEGNKGLCGSQLNKSCVSGPSPPPSKEADQKDGDANWDLISFEVGLVVGLATVVVPLVLSRRWSKWYFKHVDRIVVAKVSRYYQRRNQERKSPIRRL